MSPSWIIIDLSVIVVAQSALILYPVVKRKFGRIKFIATGDSAMLCNKVLDESARMVSTRRVSMSFTDDDSLYAVLAAGKNRLLRRQAHYQYAYFNFPLAFLLYGLLEQFARSGDRHVLRKVEARCEQLVLRDGRLSFAVDKIDQATLGLVFLRLHEVTGADRYLVAARQLYDELQRFKGTQGLYRYRLGLDIFFIDTVGLLCPFLVRYAKVTGTVVALKDAETQLDFALTRCVESGAGLTFHAYDLAREQPLGSSNWARGMGWFLLGLSAVAESGRAPAYLDALRRYSALLDGFRERHGYWAQFLGHTNDTQIDSSATLMFLYAFQQCGIKIIDACELKKLAAQCVNKRGKVVQASGDTIYINKYSRTKGPSELSQGLMLLLIAGMAE
jgi:unsaturated rhamnogalacturonyl hydrolase